VLEWAGRRPADAARPFDIAAASRAAAAAQGLAPEAAEQVAAVAGRVLASPACARFFDAPALRWAGNEVPVAEAGEALRIDRLVAQADADGRTTWWVLDYKLQAAEAMLPAYRAQVRRYMAAVQALQPGDTVRGGLITGQGRLIEI
jgi:ATP-dependent helicase/nuclease subunit A